MLQLDKVTARAGSFHLQPVDLAIGQGECHVLLGPSGAGKSTLLDLIVGFRQPEAGRIFLKGRDLATVPVEQRRIAYLPQNLALFPHVTVQENVLYGIRSRRRPNEQDLAKVAALTASLGLTALLTRRPGSLSGGERQRVALARALAASPDLLILDEPFSALNESLRRELWGIVKELQENYGVAMLMVTHDLEEAFFFGEQVHILIEGRLQQSGSRQDVFHRPATLAAARFLGIPNLFPARVVGVREDEVVLACQPLGLELTVPRRQVVSRELPVGAAVVIGIRPEFVELTLNGNGRAAPNPAVAGYVAEITETMLGYDIIFKAKTTEAVVRLQLGRREATVLDQKEGEIILPLDQMFFLPQESGPLLS